VSHLAEGDEGWQRLPNAQAAQAAADRGHFVVVGLENPNGHGHMAIVLPGGPTPRGFARTCWGSMTPGSARHPWVEGRPVGLDQTWDDVSIHGWLIFACYKHRTFPSLPPGNLPPGARTPTLPPETPSLNQGKARQAALRIHTVSAGLKRLGLPQNRSGVALFQSRYMDAFPSGILTSATYNAITRLR
jgi:hypothetical protein